MIFCLGSRSLTTNQIVQLKRNKAIVFDQDYEYSDTRAFEAAQAVIQVIDSTTDLGRWVHRTWNVAPMLHQKRKFLFCTHRTTQLAADVSLEPLVPLPAHGTRDFNELVDRVWIYALHVVAFSGYKGSGKDTCADWFVARHPQYTKTAFASELKALCKLVFNLTDYQVHDGKGKEEPFATPIVLTLDHLVHLVEQMRLLVSVPYPTSDELAAKTAALVGTAMPTPRFVLQFIGTEFMRNIIHPDWHILACLLIGASGPRGGVSGTHLVVSDARFENEYDWLVQNTHAARVYCVDRAGLTNTDAHASEVGVGVIRAKVGEDCRISNHGTLHELLHDTLPRVFGALEPLVIGDGASKKQRVGE